MQRNSTKEGLWGEFLPRLLVVMLILNLSLAPIQYAQGSGRTAAPSNEGKQTARVVSVRKVLRNQYFISRYPQIHYYMLYISMRISDQTYCAEYETPVLEEINDVSSANGTDIEVVLKNNGIVMRTPRGRKLKARLVDGKQC